MGSGKTTIGKLFSNEMLLSSIDLDQYIEKESGKKIKDIFQCEGEEAFRELETIALKERDEQVIITGGGIVERSINIAFMKQNGCIVYLHTSFAEITKRLNNDTLRPLWDINVDQRRQLYDKRIPLYKSCADVIIDTDGKSELAIVSEIKKALEYNEIP